MRKSRRIAVIPSIMLVLAVLACDDGWSPHETFPVDNRGITCITVVDGKLIAPMKVGGYTENAGNYDVFTSDSGGFMWQAEFHRETYSPNGFPYGDAYPSNTVYETGDVPPCEAARVAVDPNNPNHKVRIHQGLRIEETTDGMLWHVINDLPELRQEIRYYDFGNTTFYGDIPVLALGPHDVDFDPKTGNIVFAMGWDGVLVYTPKDQWVWVSVGRYSRGYLNPRDGIGDILMAEYLLAGALGFLVLTSLVSYLVRRSMYQISMLVIGWIGWALMLIAGTPVTVSGIMPGVGHSDVYLLLGAPLLLLVALPMTLACLYDLIRYLWRRSIFVVLMSALIAAAYLMPYYLWVEGTIFRYETAKWMALLISVGLVTMFAQRVRSTSQKWAQRIILPPKPKKGQHPIEYVPLGSVLERE